MSSCKLHKHKLSGYGTVSRQIPRSDIERVKQHNESWTNCAFGLYPSSGNPL